MIALFLLLSCTPTCLPGYREFYDVEVCPCAPFVAVADWTVTCRSDQTLRVEGERVVCECEGVPNAD